MADVMLQLGFYQFSVDSAAYQELTRSAEYRWAAQERIGATDALQFTGYGSETIQLRGVIYPFHKGGLGQLDSMRRQAALGLPLPLVSGQGSILGLWVVEAVREGQRIFAPGGAPRRQEFDLQLRRYDGGLRALLPF
jgi:hypothetical protein